MTPSFIPLARNEFGSFPSSAISGIEPAFQTIQEILLGRSDSIGAKDAVEPSQRGAFLAVRFNGGDAAIEKLLRLQIAIRCLAGG